MSRAAKGMLIAFGVSSAIWGGAFALAVGIGWTTVAAVVVAALIGGVLGFIAGAGLVMGPEDRG